LQYFRLEVTARDSLLADLAAMPAYIRSSFESLSTQQLRQRDPGGAFCPLAQVWHLADLEVEGFGVRIDRLLNERNPCLDDFDGAALARQRNYRALSLDAGLIRFERARRANLQKLRNVPAHAWTNSGTQDGVGRVSLCDMPVFLRQHDQAHKTEILAWQQHAAGGPPDPGG
jgi:hypothetical protein